MNTFEKLEKLAEINDYLNTFEQTKNDTAHPEIEVYRKVGDPSVSIRKVAQ